MTEGVPWIFFAVFFVVSGIEEINVKESTRVCARCVNVGVCS